MVEVPPGVNDACAKLIAAAIDLQQAVDGLADSSAWTKRRDDLKVVREEIVDIRQQLEMLKLEVEAEA